MGSFFPWLLFLCRFRLLSLPLDESESLLEGGSDESYLLFLQQFSSYRVSFSLMTSLTMISLMTSLMMMVLGPGYLVRAIFHFLKIRWSCQWNIFI